MNGVDLIYCLQVLGAIVIRSLFSQVTVKPDTFPNLVIAVRRCGIDLLGIYVKQMYKVKYVVGGNLL